MLKNDAVIENIYAREILDGIGKPAIEVKIIVQGGAIGSSSVASPMFKTSHKILKDQDSSRFEGEGVKKCIEYINGIIAENLVGTSILDQRAIDLKLLGLDGTHNKSKLGANAILAVSIAASKAAAAFLSIPLYQYLGGINACIMPVPIVSLLNGTNYNDTMLDLKEIMLAPIGAKSFKEAIRMCAEISHNLASYLNDNGYHQNLTSHGALAPNLKSSIEALDLVMQIIEKTGYRAGYDVVLALDIGAYNLLDHSKYLMKGENKTLSTKELVDYIQTIVAKYPVYYIEDPLAEHDNGGWVMITDKLGNDIHLAGDAIFSSYKEKIADAARRNVANAIVIRPIDIGTVTEVMESIDFAHKNGYNTIIAHQDKDTDENFISHLAVSMNSGQIKAGGLFRSEKISKYNELLEIEEQMQIKDNYYGTKALRSTLKY